MPGRLGPLLKNLDRLAVFTATGPLSGPYVDGLPRAELVQYSGADGDTALAAGFDVVQGEEEEGGAGLRGPCCRPPLRLLLPSCRVLLHLHGAQL